MHASNLFFVILWNIQYLNELVHTISIPLIVIIVVEVKVLCTLILLLNFYEYLCLNYYQLYCLRILSFTSFSLWLFINQWENKERPVFVYIVNISVCSMSYAFSQSFVTFFLVVDACTNIEYYRFLFLWSKRLGTFFFYVNVIWAEIRLNGVTAEWLHVSDG